MPPSSSIPLEEYSSISLQSPAALPLSARRRRFAQGQEDEGGEGDGGNDSVEAPLIPHQVIIPAQDSSDSHSSWKDGLALLAIACGLALCVYTLVAVSEG